MNERALSFGQAEHLVGVLHEPASPRAGAPGVLLLNAGLLHRVGPFRMSVDLARRLGRAGVPSLRFDLSGIGDSDTATTEGYTERALRDIRDAMTLLSRRSGAERFVLVGLCSGAYNAHATAVADERVAGAVFLDGYAYRTPRFHLHYYGPRLVDPRRWLRFVRRKLQARPPEDPPVIFETEAPPRGEFERDLRALVERGAELLYVYSGGAENYYGYAEQLYDAFPFARHAENVEVAFFPEADHTYVLLAHRRALLERVGDWMQQRWMRG